MKNKIKLTFIYILIPIIIVLLFIPTLKNINFGLDLQGGFEILYKIKPLSGNGELTGEDLNNTYKTSFANKFKEVGYNTASIHFNNGFYYNRKEFHENLGYDNHYALKDMKLNHKKYDYEYDSNLLKDEKVADLIVREDKFLTYIITYSAHLPYAPDDIKCKEINYGLRGTNEELTCIKNFAKETDEMIRLLIKKLNEEKKLDDTVLIFTTDHYIYGYSYISDLRKESNVYKLQNTPFIIWSKNIEHKDIDILLDSADILPTIFNMFDISYDPNLYIGEDVFSKNRKNYVYFNEETYLKDIIAHNKIEKTQELEDLINILASGTGSLTNPTRILQTFKTVLHSKISINTIIKYLDYLKDAFLVNEVNRYDVKGRKYIGSPNKYYFEDVGLRNARLNFRQTEETHLMENVIYNELRYRGFNVDVGIVEKRERDENGKEKRTQYEIDFVATQGSKKYYIQSAFFLGSAEKIEQEKKSLKTVSDSFKKIIIVKDIIKPLRDEDGILTISLFDFLQNENSLEI